jgi:hypothetical protein
MGWYYHLEVQCNVHPDFLTFYRKDFLRKFDTIHAIFSKDHECTEECESDCKFFYEEDYRNLPKSYKDLLECWIPLDIASFYGYELSGSQLTIHLSKKVHRHEGDLWAAYETFLHDILVPTTTEITSCKISSDDYGCRERIYTDLELRGKRLDLPQLIRSVHHVWEEGCISETRVVYKRGIPASQQLDLDRLYGR